MRRLLLTSLASLGLLGFLAAGPAPAQVVPYYPGMVNPYYRPVVSPYLNLALPGSRAINYYGLVRPQIEQTNAIQQLQTQTIANQQALLATQGAGVLPGPYGTGHAAGFLNHYAYFQNWRNRPGGIGTVGGPAVPAYGTGVTPGFATAVGPRPLGR
jgi:hypothetical protein